MNFITTNISSKKMMRCHDYQLWQAALANERGVSFLESEQFLQALTEFVEGHRIALNIRQVLDDSGLIPLSLQQAASQGIPSVQQMLFPANDDTNGNHNDSSRSKKTSGILVTDTHFLYKRGLTYSTTDLATEQGKISSDPYYLLHHCNLLLATCAYNIGLCFHVRSVELTEKMMHLCQQIALDLYNTAIETISVDRLIAHNTAANDDSSCLLVVLLNNKAVICYESGDYDACQETRKLLLLWLNALGGACLANSQPQDNNASRNNSRSAFLNTQDITNMYRNGFMLIPPAMAGAA